MKQEIAMEAALQRLPDLLEKLQSRLSAPEKQIQVSTGDWLEQLKFNKHCQIFNRRFKEKPWIIVYCHTEADVQITYELAIDFEIPVRIRAGGHDHEGECTGTNTILIDVSKMDKVQVNEHGLATIGPGNIFKNLTSQLAEKDVMIAHGTCATVGISGFIMGGGWGPWTRKHGMCCEWLTGANMILGNGEKAVIDAKGDEVPDLLWALRGGGAMSYGLVTEFRIQTFPLPKTLIRFSLEWNSYKPLFMDHPRSDYPTIQVLKAWENVITSPDTSQLIGTNLQINAKPAGDEPFDANTVSHNCVMYGYWEGEQAELEVFVKKWFKSVPNYKPKYNDDHGGTGTEGAYGDKLMSNWARNSHHKVLEALYAQEGKNSGLNEEHIQMLAEGKPLPPDYDNPAPHKITSRLVDKEGLGEGGYEALLKSLTSDLLFKGNRRRGLFTYVTLGAIVGDYYRNNPEGANSSFPYKDKLYTIQYQTWWNEKWWQKWAGQDNTVYNRTNRAMDWMQVARDFDIPNTSGAFISFKDSSIPTRTYFAQNYDRLVQIKEDYSKDKYNHLRVRKSII